MALLLRMARVCFFSSYRLKKKKTESHTDCPARSNQLPCETLWIPGPSHWLLRLKKVSPAIQLETSTPTLCFTFSAFSFFAEEFLSFLSIIVFSFFFLSSMRTWHTITISRTHEFSAFLRERGSFKWFPWRWAEWGSMFVTTEIEIET